MSKRLCSFSKCQRVHYALGYCNTHYGQLLRTERVWEISSTRIAPTLSIEERIPIWKRRSVVNENGCWLWQGSTIPEGYGNVHYQGEIWLLHELVWTHFNGPVPVGHELDHLCRNRACWNPSIEHLEAVTHQVNVQRGLWGVLRTQCVRGHIYNTKNTRIDSRGYRVCRLCHNLLERKYQQQRKTA